jgi:hypothetical protein
LHYSSAAWASKQLSWGLPRAKMSPAHVNTASLRQRHLAAVVVVVVVCFTDFIDGQG